MPPRLNKEEEKKMDDQGQIYLWIPIRFYPGDTLPLIRPNGEEVQVEVIEAQNLGERFRFLHLLKTLRHSALEIHMTEDAEKNGRGPRISSLPANMEELVDSDHLALIKQVGAKITLSKGPYGEVFLDGGDFKYQDYKDPTCFYRLPSAAAVVECIRDWDRKVLEMQLVDVILTGLAKLVLPSAT